MWARGFLCAATWGLAACLGDAAPPREADAGSGDAAVTLVGDLGGAALADSSADLLGEPADLAQPCPAAPAGTIMASLAFGEVRQHRMASGVIAAFPVAASPSGRSAVHFTQGQQPSTPAGVVTELTVSRCPGVMTSQAPECVYRSTNASYNEIVAYSRAVNGWDSQTTLGGRGCWAPASEGPWFVNVRWIYASCPFAECGFSLQWSEGAW